MDDIEHYHPMMYDSATGEHFQYAEGGRTVYGENGAAYMPAPWRS